MIDFSLFFCCFFIIKKVYIVFLRLNTLIKKRRAQGWGEGINGTS